ncbi:MAG: DUF1080 domain-containing protein [Pirellulaceae bacterium]|nr:DUF1080 domain-containing protein [Pirellulaceae bacterium]
MRLDLTMRYWPILRGVGLGLLIAHLTSTGKQLAAQQDPDTSAWTLLFNGHDLHGWVPVNVAPDTFSARDGMIVSTGKPTGVMRTEKMYENFIVELQWRHMQPGGNAGLFLWGDGLPAPGIPFSRGIEVQILDNAFNIPGKNQWYTTHGDLFPIHGAKMTPRGRVAKSGTRSFPSHEFSKSSPEWNHYRVVANHGCVTLSVNGQQVTEGIACWPRKGYICLESEGSECHFRDIRIQELPSTGVSDADTARAADGWLPLFTGINLDNWIVPEGDGGHWRVVDEVIDYDALSEAPGDKSLWSAREYNDFQLIVDWRIKEAPFVNSQVPQILSDGSEAVDAQGQPVLLSLADADSGIFLRGQGTYQVNIWCWPIGSGEMYGVRRDPKMPPEVRAAVTPKVKADHPIGQWNRFEITVLGRSVSVILNDTTVIDKAFIPDMPPRGRIALQHHGSQQDGQWTSSPSLVQFRNIMIKEL